MDGILQDLRFALRTLARARGFTFVAVLTLALGIGSNTAIFSVLNTVLLDPLPYPEPQQLVRIWSHWDSEPAADVSPAEYLDYKAQLTGVESIAAYGAGTVNVAGGAQPVRVRAANVSASLFSTLRAQPLLGRTFRAEED